MRLAGARDADAFALRGGALVHRWVPEARRPVGDLDLVCALPRSHRDLRERLRDVLARRVSDGVAFDAERFRLDVIPIGFRLFAAGEVDGRPAELAVDLAFGVDVFPAAVRVPGAVAECPHGMVIATKLAVTAELGAHAWRAKDLADLWLAVRRFSAESVGPALKRRAGTAAAATQVLAARWWREPRAAMRWARHVARRALVPLELSVALADVRSALA